MKSKALKTLYDKHIRGNKEQEKIFTQEITMAQKSSTIKKPDPNAEIPLSEMLAMRNEHCKLLGVITTPNWLDLYSFSLKLGDGVTETPLKKGTILIFTEKDLTPCGVGVITTNNGKMRFTPIYYRSKKYYPDNYTGKSEKGTSSKIRIFQIIGSTEEFFSSIELLPQYSGLRYIISDGNYSKNELLVVYDIFDTITHFPIRYKNIV